MLLQGYTRDFLKKNPELSFAKKPHDRRLLKVVRILNNDCHLGHIYSNWARFLLDEHNEDSDTLRYFANIVFTNGHQPLVKIIPYKQQDNLFTSYKIVNAVKPQAWTFEHPDLVKKIVKYCNHKAGFDKEGNTHILRPAILDDVSMNRFGRLSSKPNYAINYSDQFFSAGNPKHESHQAYRHDAERIKKYVTWLIKATIMEHNLGIINGYTKGREW